MEQTGVCVYVYVPTRVCLLYIYVCVFPEVNRSYCHTRTAIHLSNYAALLIKPFLKGSSDKSSECSLLPPDSLRCR